jgi:hypothetical protein
MDTPDTDIKLFGYENHSMTEHDRFQEWRKANWHGGFMSGLLLDENGLYEYESPLVPMRIEGDCSAIGSGVQTALGAMLMGADPGEAVRIACAIARTARVRKQ